MVLLHRCESIDLTFPKSTKLLLGNLKEIMNHNLLTVKNYIIYYKKHITETLKE